MSPGKSHQLKQHEAWVGRGPVEEVWAILWGPRILPLDKILRTPLGKRRVVLGIRGTK